MKRKIMFFLFSLSGGGAERTIINIVNNLDKDNYDVLLVLGTKKNNDYNMLLNNNIEIKVLNCSKLRYCIFKLAKSIRKEKPDILFSTINANNIVALLAKILSFKSVFAVVREANNRTQAGKVTKLNKQITKILYNKVADKIVALSNGVKKDLVTNFLIKKHKVHVIYNPVEVDKIKEQSRETIKENIKSNEEKLIIAVGRLVEQKDFQSLIRAFSIVSTNIDSKLLILGKGPQEKKLIELSTKLGVRDKVWFLGFKTNPYKYMAKADLFILTSKWEGFGHVIVEAMATGTPVISTNCKSGPEEILQGDRYGILVPVGDYQTLAQKIFAMLENDDLRQYYVLNGYKRSKDFNAKQIVKKYELIFDVL